MRVNRIQFGKIKLQWQIKKYASGVILGDEAIGEILSGRENNFTGIEALQALAKGNLDVLLKEDLQSSKKYDSLLESSKDNKYASYLDKALTSEKMEMDMFGDVRKWSEKEVIEEQMRELEKLGRKLLDEEKYEEMQEAQEIYDKLKIELDKL